MCSRFSTCFTERALSSFVEIRCIKKFGKNANLGCSENRFFFYLFFTEKSMNLKKASPPEREKERERERGSSVVVVVLVLVLVVYRRAGIFYTFLSVVIVVSILVAFFSSVKLC